jgi:hypothetical protein
MPDVTVLSLRCPRCGGGLAGTPHDVVFWCSACGIPQEIAGSGFVERPGKLAAPAAPHGAGDFYLPVWALRVSYTCRWEDSEKAARARLIPPIEWVYVTGYAIHNAGYFGDPGMIFTEKRVLLAAPAERDREAVVAGCARSLEDAKAFVQPHLLTIIDRRVDVTGLDLSVSVSDGILWGVPYREERDVLRDAVLGLTIPAAAIIEFSEIRAGQRKR